MFGVDRKRLREDLLSGNDGNLRRRRAVIGVSLIGVASMAAVTLLQTGITRHLPEPPIPGLDSDKVVLSNDAFELGVPDGSLAAATLAANLPLASFGDADRAKEQPWAPIVAAAKATVDTAVSAWSFYRMLKRERAWCAYCVIGAIANAGVLALTVPEAVETTRKLGKDGRIW